MFLPFSAVLFGASLSAAIPLSQRAVTQLNQAATAESHKRDDAATRAFSSVEIKTADGKCLLVDPLSGDFRSNLTPIQVANCNGSAAQKWDFITKGIHNNQAGTTLVVSALTQACMNIDERRAAGNQVLLFSCGGRADGSSQVSNSQLFKFTAGQTTTTLEPLNTPGTCFTVKGNVIDKAACDGSAAQKFTIGGGAAAPPAANPPAASPPAAAPSAECSAPAPIVSTVTAIRTVTVTAGAGNAVGPSPPALVSSSSSPSSLSSAASPVATAPSANPTTAVPVKGAGRVLNPEAAAESHQFDATAVRALTKVQVKDSTGKCLFIDPVAGDFRQNLIPITAVACDGSQNQQFDLITSGKHNVGQKNQALIVSSLMNGCVNTDSRRAAGDQVNIFSCGGRAAGEGGTQGGQLFAFTGNNGAQTLTPQNAPGTCLIVKNGRLDQTPCVAGAADQLFTFVTAGAGAGAGNGGAAQPPAATSSAAASPPAATTTAAQPAITAPPANSAPAGNPTTPVPVSRAGGELRPADAAQSHQRDNTATRAFSNVQLKSADGRCLSINPAAGDFRQNLIPIEVKACDNSANQKFDLITKGKHNNAQGATLIVSSLMNGCVNFDSRRAAGDTTLIFSCGGRADGDGQTTDSQLFPFTGGRTITLAPQTARGATCLAPKGGLLDSTNCSGDASQQFTIV